MGKIPGFNCTEQYRINIKAYSIRKLIVSETYCIGLSGHAGYNRYPIPDNKITHCSLHWKNTREFVFFMMCIIVCEIILFIYYINPKMSVCVSVCVCVCVCMITIGIQTVKCRNICFTTYIATRLGMVLVAIRSKSIPYSKSY